MNTTTTRPSSARQRTPTWTGRLDRPETSYFALVWITVALVVFGLVMVLSASTVESLTRTDSRSPYTIFIRQAVYAALGGIALIVAARMRVRQWKWLALPVLAVGLVLQALVFTRLGEDAGGNQNWLTLGFITIQPAEFLKVGLALSGALILSAKRGLVHRLGHALVPYVIPLAALALGLVLLGRDLGTAIVMAAIVGGVLFMAGVPGRWFAVAAGGFAATTVALVATSSNRLRRLDVWLGRDTDPFGTARQPIHGRYALADGGWFGLGLGNSREKWSWLAEPHNDFIFAIIGEELGIAGTILVLALFAALAVVCNRIVVRSEDVFVRIATAGIMSWIIAQAIINMGSVIGVIPVIGVPLPLVSAGGSSLVTTMLALGILLSFARAEPGCGAALSARASLLTKSASVLPRRRSKPAR